ncbi:MAG TPA: DUF924 family protein [Burkholderiales bacterium]|nr:DUF924 family protein [Burkholderiales bacterium]
MRTAAAYDVLDFWFGAPGSVQYGRPRAEWFRKSDTFDALIRSRFLRVYEQAAAGNMASWRDSPLTQLALIIVLDQFPRNMFRDSRAAFATDAMALEVAGRMTALHWDTRLLGVERQFCYLPFEHAEDIEAQRTCVHFFRAMGNADLLEWAQKHYNIIERFGRFPHRNAGLGRVSTPEEIDFLQEPGSRF